MCEDDDDGRVCMLGHSAQSSRVAHAHRHRHTGTQVLDRRELCRSCKTRRSLLTGTTPMPFARLAQASWFPAGSRWLRKAVGSTPALLPPGSTGESYGPLLLVFRKDDHYYGAHFQVVFGCYFGSSRAALASCSQQAVSTCKSPEDADPCLGGLFQLHLHVRR